FFAPGGARNLAVVADPDGVVFVIGAAGDNPSAVLVRRYDRNGSTWAYTGSSSQALPSTGDPLTQFAAEYVGGTTPTIFLVARRAGTVGAGALSYATIRPGYVATSGAIFANYGSDTSWLPTPPAGAAPNSGVLDVAKVSGTRLA